MKITLDAGEMAVANVVAAMRTAVNRSSGVAQTKIGPQSYYQTDLDGVVGEIAFCKWKNVCPDLSVSPRQGGADAVVNGKRVDVKTTRHPDGKLLAVVTKNIEDADTYVLAIVKDNEVDFVGWAFAHELLDDNNIVDLGRGQTYCLPQSRLRSFKE